MTVAAEKETVLIVDDSPENVDVLGECLRPHHRVVAALNGERALSLVAGNPKPDIVLLDIEMPDMSGYQVCERLKADPVSREIPVIFISAMHDTVDKVKAFGVGAVDYVTKPFQADEVIARVETHLALRRTQRALQLSHEQLRGLEAMRDDMVHMIVHDLRSPLTALMYNLRFLRDALGDKVDAQGAEDFLAADRSIVVMTGMTNDLLDVSRLETQGIPLVSQSNDLVAIVRLAVDNVKRIDPTREISIEGQPSARVSCDADLIRRVVENLVSNGLKHTPRGRPLRITVALAPEPRVSVQDEGDGVPLAYRQTIFDKFGTVKAREARKYHSAGLGLAFCKLAVEAHGGRIGVDSEVGQGSTFWFTLPTQS